MQPTDSNTHKPNVAPYPISTLDIAVVGALSMASVAAARRGERDTERKVSGTPLEKGVMGLGPAAARRRGRAETEIPAVVEGRGATPTPAI